MRDLQGPHGVITPYEGNPHRDWDSDATIPAPLRVHQTPVKPEWVDYNKHMSESCYLLVFGDNSDAFFRYVGIDEAYRASGLSFYTVETHIHYLREAMEGEPLRLSYQLLDLDRKRAHVFQAMHHGGSGALLATAEQLLVHVDLHTGRSAPLPGELYERLLAIRAAHALLPTPEQAGHTIGIRRPRDTP
ncbi:thioesterase family protein [Aquincola sp. S2]|uniref:Thioesterase family protein n=1 Tax=Pseudaquabacterium terrae TaxID=2732868 RepID=A0ABX2EUI8_9BURK|nr:thioesterase family protein [Aquabacterium terrae]NRF72312.1 thioesterase family protein [Aquabacterium terrae]